MLVGKSKAKIKGSNTVLKIEGRFFYDGYDIFYWHPINGSIIRDINEIGKIEGYRDLVEQIKNDNELYKKVKVNMDIEY